LENSYQKFAKDVLIYGIATVFIQLSSVILIPLITKTLGAHDYGIWAQSQVTISLAMTLSLLGLTVSMLRFLPAKTNAEEIQEEFYSVFYVIAAASLILSIIFIVFADFIAAAFFGGATEVVRVTGLIILVYSLDTAFLTLFRAFQQVKKYSLFMIANTYGQIGLIAYLALNGHGILSIVLAVLSVQALLLFILFYIIKAQIGFKRPHFLRMKEYFNFGMPTVTMSLASWVIYSSDRYVIAYFLGATFVGIYSAAYTLGSIIVMFAGVVGFVLPPLLSKLYDEGRISEVKTLLSYSLKYLLALAIPFVFGAAVLAKPVLILFSTAEIAGEGYLVMSLITLAMLLACANSVIFLILVLVKKMKLAGAIYVIVAAISLGLNILVVPYLGILGAAITALISYSLVLGLITYYSLKEFKFTIDWRFIIKSLVASAIMSSAIWLMHPQSNLATIITVVAGVAVYVIALLLLKGFNKEEFKFFRELFQIGKASSP
jgi:O-antigen/teichoic acid export membrane protein